MEGFEVPYTKEGYKREVARELFQKMPSSERRELLGLSVEELEAYLKELRSQASPGGDAATG